MIQILLLNVNKWKHQIIKQFKKPFNLNASNQDFLDQESISKKLGQDEFWNFSNVLKRISIPKLIANKDLQEQYSIDFLKQIPENFDSLTEEQKREIVENFKKVRSLADMKKFCNNSNSLYLKVCMWCMENSVKIMGSKLEKHHIFPRFYVNDPSFALLSKEQVFVKFNEVSVPRDIHMFLHLLRFKEYEELNDQLALYVVLGKMSKKMKKINDSSNLLFSSLIDTIENEYLKNNSSFKNIGDEQLLIASLGGRKAALKFSLDLKKLITLITQNLVWKNDSLGIGPKEINVLDSVNLFTEMSPSQVDENWLKNNLLLRDYVFILMNFVPSENKPVDWNTEISLKKYVRALKNYLLGNYSQKRTFFGWELVNITAKMKEKWKKGAVAKSLINTKQKSKEQLEKKNYYWKNIFFPELPIVYGKNNDFQTIAEITEYLLQLFIDNLDKKQIKYRNIDAVLQRYFVKKDGKDLSQINRRFSEVFSKKHSNAYGWTVTFF